MTRHSFLLLLTFLLTACLGDAEKNISTDQQVEGTEIFRITQSLEESLFFALQSFEYYKTVAPETLPGCPAVTVNDANRSISLVFSANSTCTNNANTPRTGRILLQYITRSVLESSVVLTYDNYFFKGNAIEGLREFRRLTSIVNPNRRTEIFENLIIRNEKNSSSRLNGSFVHQVTFQNTNLTQFSSGGTIEGRNIAGRAIKMTQGTLKNYEVACILAGTLMPKQGSESWEIAHSAGQLFTHNLSYTGENPCRSTATLKLQDGRVMVVQSP
jgi:hypothetical protein